MKKIALIALLTQILSGCFIATTIQGNGRVTSTGGHDCSTGNIGTCTVQYTQEGSESFTAEADSDSTFSKWAGCTYASIDSCETQWTQDLADNGWSGEDTLTLTATFKEKSPPVQPAQYTYNALGQRITKTVGTKTTIFQYDLDGNLMAELDSSTELPVRQYVYVNGEPIAQLSTAGGVVSVQYVHADHLGTPNLLTNQDGKVVADIEATPFGEAFIDYASVTHNRRFPGQYKDEETGLHYNYFRDYDPSLGRYIQSDPIGLQGGINTYAYVGGNPTKYTDPFGLYCYSASQKGCEYLDPGYVPDNYSPSGFSAAFPASMNDDSDTGVAECPVEEDPCEQLLDTCTAFWPTTLAGTSASLLTGAACIYGSGGTLSLACAAVGETASLGTVLYLNSECATAYNACKANQR